MKNADSIIRKDIIFHGRVQGVGFRYYSVQGATALGLTGTVENLYDGTVHMEVQGTEAAIDRLIVFLQQRRYIVIDSMDVHSLPVVEDEYSFREKESW